MRKKLKKILFVAPLNFALSLAVFSCAKNNEFNRNEQKETPKNNEQNKDQNNLQQKNATIKNQNHTSENNKQITQKNINPQPPTNDSIKTQNNSDIKNEKNNSTQQQTQNTTTNTNTNINQHDDNKQNNIALIENLKLKLIDLKNELNNYLLTTKQEAQYKYEEVNDLLENEIANFDLPMFNSDEQIYTKNLNEYYNNLTLRFNQIKDLKNSLSDLEDLKPNWAGDNYNKLTQKKEQQQNNLLVNYPQIEAISASLKEKNRRDNPQNTFINDQVINFLKFGGNGFVEKFSEIGYTNEQREKVKNFLYHTIIKESMSKKEQIRAIFDWITANVKYASGKNAPRINPWEIIQYRYAVCGGYSNLYKEMLDLIGVNSVMVIGWSSAGDHQWVLIEDPETQEWFYSDATWGALQKRYFRLNSQEISNDHRVIRMLNYTLSHNEIQYEYWKGLSIKDANVKNVEAPNILDAIKIENISNTLLNNSNLKTLKIGKYVTNIEYQGMLANLESFEVDEQNSFYASFDSALYNKDLSQILATPLGYLNKNITLSKYTKTLKDGKELFNSPFLKSIQVQPGNYSFASYKGLLYNNDFSQLVSVPAGITHIYVHPSTILIGQEFSFKDFVEEIYLEQGIENIPDFTFNSLPKLKNVYIPNTIKKISSQAFLKIKNITLITNGYNEYVDDYAKLHNFKYKFN
ncbi:transglutaminase domain-containing protein [Mycoplasmopsis phocirhinis]|nr:transglutaminase domain-containing protein [Mycoplasmopsis phocirhinis]